MVEELLYVHSSIMFHSIMELPFYILYDICKLLLEVVTVCRDIRRGLMIWRFPIEWKLLLLEYLGTGGRTRNY